MIIRDPENERIDELNDRGYKIIQNKKGFRFGLDSVLLTAFAIVREGEKCLDLGTGTGVIPLLLEAKTAGASFTGLEIQESVAEMAKRSVKLNGLEEKVNIITGDIKEAAALFPGRPFDVVTSNPPYMTVKEGLISGSDTKAISRTEIKCTLRDVVRAAAAVLKDHGRFYMVHRPSRLTEITSAMTEFGFSVRNIRFVYPKADQECNLLLVEGIWRGKTQCRIEKPCIVFDDEGKYTKEMDDIYFHEVLMTHER